MERASAESCKRKYGLHTVKNGVFTMSAFGVRSEVVPPRSDAVSAFPTYGNPYFHRRSVDTDYRKCANGDRFCSCVSLC